jgi:hypothetical protein
MKTLIKVAVLLFTARREHSPLNNELRMALPAGTPGVMNVVLLSSSNQERRGK